MNTPPYPIEVKFHCQHCGQAVEVVFGQEPVSAVSCPKCSHLFTVMKPTIAEEILIDWENEALFQKIRADKSEHNHISMMALVIRVIELLTWRDKGNGQVEAIKEMRRWLMENEPLPPLAELIQMDSGRPHFRRDLEK